jgi:hypothetical protein
MPEVRMQLQALERVAEPAQAEMLLLELDPYCMDTYHAFCRLFVRQGRWREAEDAALAALCVSARACGLDPDWRVQKGQSFSWKFPGPAEIYYLAALEALATVRRMQGRADEHAAIATKLVELGVVPKRERASSSRLPA